MWHATILTIFPEMFPGPLGTSLAGGEGKNRDCRLSLWGIQAIAIDV